jgi:hypothetical protein
MLIVLLREEVQFCPYMNFIVPNVRRKLRNCVAVALRACPALLVERMPERFYLFFGLDVVLQEAERPPLIVVGELSPAAAVAEQMRII